MWHEKILWSRKRKSIPKFLRIYTFSIWKSDSAISVCLYIRTCVSLVNAWSVVRILFIFSIWEFTADHSGRAV
jgi:hypothetical protein